VYTDSSDNKNDLCFKPHECFLGLDNAAELFLCWKIIICFFLLLLLVLLLQVILFWCCNASYIDASSRLVWALLTMSWVCSHYTNLCN